MIRLTLLLLLIFQTPAFAEGVSVRGGGTDVAIDFVQALSRALDLMRDRMPALYREIEPLDLPGLFVERDGRPPLAKIHVVDEVQYVETPDGPQESVATNDSKAMDVALYGAGWKTIKNLRYQDAIALHEALSLKGKERTGYYPYSAAYLADFRLRRDRKIFLSGQDSVDETWKSIRFACEERYQFRDLTNNQIRNHESFTPIASASWTLLGKTYSLNVYFGQETKGFLGTTLLTASEEREVSRDDRSVLREISGRSLVRTKANVVMEFVRTPDRQLDEILGAGQTQTYEWKQGKRGALLKVTEENTLPDGTVRSVAEQKNASRVGGHERLQSRTECLGTLIPSGDWITLTGDQAIIAEIEKINVRALLVGESYRQRLRCEQRTEECPAELLRTRRQEEARQLKNFEEAFRKVFDERKAKLKAKRFDPEAARKLEAKLKAQQEEAKKMRAIYARCGERGPKSNGLVPKRDWNGKAMYSGDGVPWMAAEGQAIVVCPHEMAMHKKLSDILQKVRRQQHLQEQEASEQQSTGAP